MDNQGLIQTELVEIHETTHSMNFIQEKPEDVSTHEENGHVTMEALPCIDIMLESSVQNVQENDAPIMYENTKQNQYDPNDAVKLSDKCEDPELHAEHDQMGQLDNMSAIEVDQNQILEGQENQVMEVQQDHVIIQTTEILSFETSNEQENSNLDQMEDEEAVKECELLDGENGDLNPEEYTAGEIANVSQYDDNIQQESAADYVSEDYVNKEESLQQDDDTVVESNEFEHLTTTSEMQLSNEDEVDGQPQDPNFISTAEGDYEDAAQMNTGEAEINEEEANRPITYRQQNIINMAAASANIDIQEETSMSEIDQEENKLLHTEVGSSSMEGDNITLNSRESVEDSGLQKGEREEEEEATGEVIEEIYFIQDVSNSNLEEDKDVSDVNEVETVVTISQSPNVGNQSVKDEPALNSTSRNAGISEKSRNVIQDIFDDWGDENVDENVEEDNQMLFRDQDTVEIELNNLLNEKKKVPVSKEVQGTSKGTVDKSTDIPKPEAKSTQSHTTEVSIKTARNSSKDIPSYVQPYIRGDDPTEGGTNSKRKMQSPRLGVKVPSRLLKSQIASPAEVTEVLKERLREKQKNLESPQAADIVFVKKLTQRFASKICSGGTLPVPGLIPLSQPTRGTSDNNERSESSNQSNENTDNRELLAILEGDVDPDWSNLKSQTSAEDNPEIEGDSGLTKLSPMVQREIALKQLQELPGTGNKRGRKKSINPAPSKLQDTEKPPKDDVKKEISKVYDDIKLEPVKPKDIPRKSLKANDLPRKPLKENDSQNTTSVTPRTEIRIDETRSGRKRKPTEKALEQYASKRQKIAKAKTPNKKDLPESTTEKSSNKSPDKTSSVEIQEETNKNLSKTPETSLSKEATDKQIETDKSASLKKDKSLIEKKQSPAKEIPSSITLKKFTAKKLITQKVLSLKKSSINLKSKLSSPVRPVGRPPKSATKPVGRPKKTEALKPKKKGNKEIDRLLQDEGVVNLLYDVGQPRTRRLVPITKSQKKVMDIDKAERDLNIRKKLVKNAVLKLRSSDAETDKIAPRSKRTPLVNTEAEENSTTQTKSSGSAITSPTEFIYPAKIRNAADASVIVRRHSSSSFSSVSGSPRVSIDGPIDGSKADDENHGLRSAKRKHSIDKDVKQLDVIKRIKQKASQNFEPVASKSKVEKVADVPEDKIATVKKQNKTAESKKIEKTPRPSDASEVSSNESSKPAKIATRSNGATIKKVIPKNKKVIKNKSSEVSSDNASSTEETTKSQDELSACLAEAATALSTVSGLPRRGGTGAGRKTKSSASVDSSNAKSVSKLIFSNKEINVHRNGNLVQLTLTPSSSKIVNGITLEVMQELRDILSVLKTDEECRVVLLTSTGKSFCEGLDLSTLLHSDKKKRKQYAEEMANAVKDFIKCLATFTKPLVAGVQGAAVGLGVTILPLFDLVIASDKATFYTPYGKLGQIPEGAAIMTLSHVHGSAVASELLLGGRTLTASEALRAGLVTRVLWPDRFPLELVPSVKAMSEQSSQSMEATKALLRQSLRNKLNAALESETHILVQHWCSAECQEAIKEYMARKTE